jgi:hypothetical protein
VKKLKIVRSFLIKLYQFILTFRSAPLLQPSSSDTRTSSSKPYNLLTALLVRNSNLLISFGLTFLTIVPLLNILFTPSNSTTTLITASLNNINLKYPEIITTKAECESFENDLNKWYYNYYKLGTLNFSVRETRNGHPLLFIVTAAVLPVRNCNEYGLDFQVGDLGTIAVR